MLPDLSGLVYLAVASLVTFPLALWKVVDIVLWITSHVSIH